MRVSTDFKVVAVSENTNSFGLRQMIMVAQDGTTCKACFNYLNVKEKGDTVQGLANILYGKMLSVQFPGGELVELGPEKAPKSVIKEVFNSN